MKKLREELKQAKEEHRQKENKWMASQTVVQEKIRALEIRNRELTDNLEKVRAEEQNLRRRLNASLRPGALVCLLQLHLDKHIFIYKTSLLFSRRKIQKARNQFL